MLLSKLITAEWKRNSIRINNARFFGTNINKISITRTETDSFGQLEVPQDKLYGAQTARSIINFPIGGEPARMPLPIIHAFGTLKKCAAIYNERAGKIDANIANN